MRIKQQDNGNIIISDLNQKTLHVLPNMYLHQHPRRSDAILITGSGDFNTEEKGISIAAGQPIYINDTLYQLPTNELLHKLSTELLLQGAKGGNTTSELPKEQDPIYIEYLKANTFEKLHAFVKTHQRNIGGKQYRNARLEKEEFLCQFSGTIIIVHLQYYYKTSAPNTIDSILMWGSTEYVLKPIKRYVYDTNGVLTGYVYEEVSTL